MNITEVRPGIFFYNTPGVGSNVFFFKTTAGVVLVDTTSTVGEMQEVLDEAGLTPEDITLLITTHADGDHIGGNSLFTCPKLAHERTLVRMRQAGIPENELPTETFNEAHKTLHYGGLHLELILTAGHKIDQTILWLPEQKVLLPSDLLFDGRYPFMMNSDVPLWLEAIDNLSGYSADVTLPGHGTWVGEKEIQLQRDYMATTWNLVKEMLGEGFSVEEMFENPNLPKVARWEKEDFFERNIVEMVEQLTR